MSRSIKLDFSPHEIENTLSSLGRTGVATCNDMRLRALLLENKLAKTEGEGKDSWLVATNLLFTLGTALDPMHAIRRVVCLQPSYRQSLLSQLILAIQQLPDDKSIADTLEQLDHLSAELLTAMKTPKHPGKEFQERHWVWNVSFWQSPDAVTLLSKVVEHSQDFPSLPTAPAIPVGFDWLSWDTPPVDPSPVPWADSTALESTLATVEHPFWGAMVATLDACNGDYNWQSLVLRSDLLRSQHRTLGDAETALESLWRRELGLYPVAPLIMDADAEKLEARPAAGAVGSCFSIRHYWLKHSLDLMAQKGIASLSEWSWRLTDAFRTELMKDDKHMMVFEQLRRRSFRLALAAETWSPVPRAADEKPTVSREVNRRETSAS